MGPSWSPDGTHIAFYRKAGFYVTAICPMDDDGSDVRVLTSGNHGDDNPSCSPDGTKIAFHRTNYDVSEQMSNIWVMDSDGSDPQQVTSQSFEADCPTWSPDGAARSSTWVSAIKSAASPT